MLYETKLFNLKRKKLKQKPLKCGDMGYFSSQEN